jgi:hypothetical protein
MSTAHRRGVPLATSHVLARSKLRGQVFAPRGVTKPALLTRVPLGPAGEVRAEVCAGGQVLALVPAVAHELPDRCPGGGPRRDEEPARPRDLDAAQSRPAPPRC